MEQIRHSRELGADPVETLVALRVLQPLKNTIHFCFAEFPRQKQELLAQFILAWRALRCSLEYRCAARQRAAALA
jgi:hypothetical protein